MTEIKIKPVEAPGWDRSEPISKDEAADIKSRQRAAERRAQPVAVVVTDFQMSFDSMVVFMIKAAIAAIPAAILLAVIFTAASAIIGPYLFG